MEKNPPSRTHNQHSHHSHTILVVDDEAPIRKMIVDILRTKGYRVLEAKNGKEALEICQDREEKVALLLTDLAMPEMSGQKLVRCFKELYPETKVIIISGYSEEQIPHLPLMFLPKPFSVKTLLKAVNQLLQE